MANSSLSCPVCMEDFGSHRQPMIVCPNGHSVCFVCIEMVPDCPFCREPKLNDLIVNRVVLEIIETMTTGTQETRHQNKSKPSTVPAKNQQKKDVDARKPPPLVKKPMKPVPTNSKHTFLNGPLCAECDQPIAEVRL